MIFELVSVPSSFLRGDPDMSKVVLKLSLGALLAAACSGCSSDNQQNVSTVLPQQSAAPSAQAQPGVAAAQSAAAAQAAQLQKERKQ
jgi:hypothetical protein